MWDLNETGGLTDRGCAGDGRLVNYQSEGVICNLGVDQDNYHGVILGTDEIGGRPEDLISSGS